MKKKYYLFAGYYELWITDRVLRRPLLLISTHFSFEKAFQAAERYDEEASMCYDTSIRSDVEAYFAHVDSEVISRMPFFDGSDYSIEHGLTDYTVEAVKACPQLQPTAQCLSDIINFLHAKGSVSLRKARALCQGKTYGELGCLVQNLIPITA